MAEQTLEQEIVEDRYPAAVKENIALHARLAEMQAERDRLASRLTAKAARWHRDMLLLCAGLWVTWFVEVLLRAPDLELLPVAALATWASYRESHWAGRRAK